MLTSIPVLSIIIPVYNVEPFLERCIKSVFAQIFTNWEMILVDDGSTDASGKICDKFASMDKRIKVLHEKNGGLSVARNRGIDIAQGKYIVFIDSDDYLCSTTIYKDSVTQMEQDNDLDVVQFSYRRVDEVENIVGEHCQTACSYAGKTLYYSNFENVAGLNNNAILTPVWNKVYRSTLFTDLRFKPGMMFEDAFFDADLFDVARKITLVAECGYAYVVNPDSIMGKKMSDKKGADAILSNIYVLDKVKDLHLPDELRGDYFARQIYEMAISILIYKIRYDVTIYTQLNKLIPKSIASHKKNRIILIICKMFGCKQTVRLLTIALRPKLQWMKRM